MAGGMATTVLVTAVVAIAVAQLLFCIVAVTLVLRILRDISALRLAATETLAHVSALAGEATGGIHDAREAAARVGAVLGTGRSFIENAIGATVLRRLAGRKPSGVGGTLGTVRSVVEGIVAIWRAIVSLRGQAHPAASAHAPSAAASGLGTGAVRELSRRSAPLRGTRAAPPAP